MGITRADLKLTNLFNHRQLAITAMVDTGATFMCVTEMIAKQLGFDPDEVSRQTVTLADGRRISAPRIAPIEIAFGNRSYITEAIVLGDEPLLGLLPLEAMDLVIDPRNQRVTVNPAHPDYPVTLAKSLC